MYKELPDRITKTQMYLFSTSPFVLFDLDRYCLGSAVGRVDSIPSTFIDFFVWDDIPNSKLRDGRSVVGSYRMPKHTTSAPLIIPFGVRL